MSSHYSTGVVKGADCSNEPDGRLRLPGCAWPDPPDGERTTPICENGAKSATRKTTRKRLAPEFFASTAWRASQRSDYWLAQQGATITRRWCFQGRNALPADIMEDAFADASKLNALGDPTRPLLYLGERNETPSLPASSASSAQHSLTARNMCHESSGTRAHRLDRIGRDGDARRVHEAGC